MELLEKEKAANSSQACLQPGLGRPGSRQGKWQCTGLKSRPATRPGPAWRPAAHPTAPACEPAWAGRGAGGLPDAAGL